MIHPKGNKPMFSSMKPFDSSFASRLVLRWDLCIIANQEWLLPWTEDYGQDTEGHQKAGMALDISTGVRVDLQLNGHLEQDFIFRV